MSTVTYSKSLNNKFLNELKKSIQKTFKGCKTIAIKMHFGELGNSTAFKPEHIKLITDILKELQINFFLYDTTVAYPGPRHVAMTHKALALTKGYGKLGEIKIDDDFVSIKEKNITHEVGKPLVDADGVLIITHFKGHDCAGFGGAIKNLGMGALSKKTKNEIHDGSKPVFDFNKGCMSCGSCARACPINGINMNGYPAKPHVVRCLGCSNCAYACPKHVIHPKLNYFDVLLAEGAYAASSTFKKQLYVTYIFNVTKSCDCFPITTKIISPDKGYLFCQDGVAIDKAAYNLVTNNGKNDVFLKYNKRSGLQQVAAAEKFGMGKMKYKLVKI